MVKILRNSQQRFRNYSVVLNVRGGEKIKWKGLSKNSIVQKLTDLNFRTPLELSNLLNRFVGIYEQSSKKSSVRKFKIDNFSGQLEIGADHGRPHYNLSIKASAKIKPYTLLRELSRILYSVDKCDSISIDPAHNYESLNNYCLKDETRSNLIATEYYPPRVSKDLGEYLNELNNNSDLELAYQAKRMFQRILYALLQTEPNRRDVIFIFNPLGGAGKSVTADYISLNPDFKALLAPQLGSAERWNTALIDQMEEFFHIHGYYPKTIIVDLTRNDDNTNIEHLYSSLENIKNGRLDSTFYGKFKRIRFKPPHLVVFTNNVPNLSALSQDRFKLFSIAEEENDFTLFKCRVSLKIDRYAKSMVTWHYVAKAESEEVQKAFYEEFMTPDMVELALAAANKNSGLLYKKDFAGDKRTKKFDNAPEPVMTQLNILLCANQIIK